MSSSWVGRPGGGGVESEADVGNGPGRFAAITLAVDFSAEPNVTDDVVTDDSTETGTGAGWVTRDATGAGWLTSGVISNTPASRMSEEALAAGGSPGLERGGLGGAGVASNPTEEGSADEMIFSTSSEKSATGAAMGAIAREVGAERGARAPLDVSNCWK